MSVCSNNILSRHVTGILELLVHIYEYNCTCRKCQRCLYSTVVMQKLLICQTVHLLHTKMFILNRRFHYLQPSPNVKCGGTVCRNGIYTVLLYNQQNQDDIHSELGSQCMKYLALLDFLQTYFRYQFSN